MDDPQTDEMRLPLYREVQMQRHTLTQKAHDEDAARRKEANSQFKMDQEARIAREKAEKARARALRKDALENMRWEAEGLHTKEDGYGPWRWTYPNAWEHPRQWATAHDVAVPPQLPSTNSTIDDAISSYAKTIQAHETEMKRRGVQRRLADDSVIEAVTERKRAESIQAAKAAQAELMEKRAAVQKAEKERVRKIKVEMEVGSPPSYA